MSRPAIEYDSLAEVAARILTLDASRKGRMSRAAYSNKKNILSRLREYWTDNAEVMGACRVLQGHIKEEIAQYDMGTELRRSGLMHDLCYRTASMFPPHATPMRHYAIPTSAVEDVAKRSMSVCDNPELEDSPTLWLQLRSRIDSTRVFLVLRSDGRADVVVPHRGLSEEDWLAYVLDGGDGILAVSVLTAPSIVIKVTASPRAAPHPGATPRRVLSRAGYAGNDDTAALCPRTNMPGWYRTLPIHELLSAQPSGDQCDQTITVRSEDWCTALLLPTDRDELKDALRKYGPPPGEE